MSAEEWIAGLHAVRTALEQAPGRISGLWLDRTRKDQRLHAIVEQATAARVHIQWVDRRELDRLAPGARHQGALCRVRAAETRSEAYLEQLLTRRAQPFLLILDGVQDPHNLGACLRSADAAGVDAVVVPRDRACGLNATVRKVASGAAESVPLVQVTNLARTLRMLQHAGLQLVGADGAAQESLYETDLRGPLGLVLGAEGKGMRRLTREHCDRLLQIPMVGVVESLNVSVAAGICLFEAVRQRGSTPD